MEACAMYELVVVLQLLRLCHGTQNISRAAAAAAAQLTCLSPLPWLPLLLGMRVLVLIDVTWGT
jgi:hypothetical protein